MKVTRTKIVATVGPASESPQMVRQLIRAGVDVFRLNFSHGTRQAHARYIETIRDAVAELDMPVAVMQDLQGPRIRTGVLRGARPIALRQGAEVVLRPGNFEGDEKTIPVTYAGLPGDVAAGDTILLRDGLIELTVLASSETEARCRVKTGGELDDHQGINLPGVDLSISAPTEKDLDDLRFGIEHEVDYVALSFVRSPGDVLRLKEHMLEFGGEGAAIPVVAKIEKPEAVDNLREILSVSDAVMVARGDLGIEMPAEAVPAAQKRIIHAANTMGVPVITATQMLESMVHSARPTRAEASDVANAILDGTDAVMLSGETAIGRYPVEAVAVMDRIARHVEGPMRAERAIQPPDAENVVDQQQHALASAACTIADQLDAAGIVPFTITGGTARYVSQRRPCTPIYALTPSARTYRRLALLWGVMPVQLPLFSTTDEMIQRGEKRLRELGLAGEGDTVVYVAGPSTQTAGGTDMLKIHRFTG